MKLLAKFGKRKFKMKNAAPSADNLGLYSFIMYTNCFRKLSSK